MAVPPFNTLALAEELQRAGFPRGQAEALTVALARVVGGAPAAGASPDAAPPDEFGRQLLMQQTEQRAWFNRAMTVWTVVNVLAIAAAAAVVYVALEPSLTPSPATLAQLFPAIAAAIIGVCGLAVSQFL